MSTTMRVDGTVRDLLHEAARWRLAGLLFGRPRPGWREELVALSAEVRDPHLAAAVADAAEASEGAYLGLLGSGGPVSPREVSYRPLEDPGRLLAEIAAFHEAFAYRTSSEEPRDHVAVAADFSAYLALKEAYAVASGHAGDAGTTREAREGFAARHVRAVARGIARRLERLEGVPAYLRAAAAGLLALAGAGTLDDVIDGDSREDAPFLRPGLDEPVFACGALGEDGTLDCASGCSWPATGDAGEAGRCSEPLPPRLTKIGG